MARVHDQGSLLKRTLDVIDVDTGLIMSVKELKGKAYGIIEEVETFEVINYVKWICKTRYVKITATQLNLFENE